MVRFFFHVRAKDGRLVEDDDGIEFDTLDLAVDDAVQSLCEMASERVRNGETIPDHSIEIADEHGFVLRELPLRSVIRFDD